MTDPERIAFMVAELNTTDACDDQCPGSDVCIGCPTKLMREAAATIAQLQQHISQIETETKSWIDDLIAEGGARKVIPLEHILAVIQSAR
jgi:hypothetical protein